MLTANCLLALSAINFTNRQWGSKSDNLSSKAGMEDGKAHPLVSTLPFEGRAGPKSPICTVPAGCCCRYDACSVEQRSEHNRKPESMLRALWLAIVALCASPKRLTSRFTKRTKQGPAIHIHTNATSAQLRNLQFNSYLP